MRATSTGLCLTGLRYYKAWGCIRDTRDGLFECCCAQFVVEDDVGRASARLNPNNGSGLGMRHARDYEILNINVAISAAVSITTLSHYYCLTLTLFPHRGGFYRIIQGQENQKQMVYVHSN